MATATGFTSTDTLVPSTQNVGVRFTRRDLELNFPAYDMIADCVAGGESVKEKRTTYLPMPDPTNQEPDNRDRYESYLTRAIFYNVTQRTALGLLGQIFIRPPKIEMPVSLDAVKNDSNGNGIGIEQLAKDACLYNIAYGRLGIFIDYPPVNKPTTRADLDSGNVRPTISIYGPKDIINWRYKVIGSKSVPSLIVVREEYTLQDDGFQTVTATQYRELRIDDAGVYFVQLWRELKPGDDKFEKFGGPYYPLDGAGKNLDAIPFTFIGSKNNEPSIDPQPLKDLATINIGHYRNSADYEEMIYLIGQPMLVISGLTNEWYENVLGKKIPFGSRKGLALPKDATAELLQVGENTAAKEGMEHKERQMVALGAKVVEQKTVQRTATEANLENTAEESTLVSIARNVSSAIQFALEWCAVFINIPETVIEFELNTDFELARMTSEQVNATVKSWQDGAISWTEMRDILRKAGRTTLTDEEAKAEIEKDATAEIERAAAEIGATTAATTANLPPVA